MKNPSPTIALVENDNATAVALGRLLRAQGFTVEIYVSGEAFLARSPDVFPDCLLLDINLDGMSGLDLQRALGQGALPVILMTGRSDPQTERLAREQGCCAYLKKPFDAAELSAAIASALTR
jgi:FixJ family two-component response regulator